MDRVSVRMDQKRFLKNNRKAKEKRKRRAEKKS